MTQADGALPIDVRNLTRRFGALRTRAAPGHFGAYRAVLSDVLCEPGAPTRHACFPTDGFISLVTAISGHPGVEAGMVGSEGMVGCIEKTHEQARA